MTRGIQPTYLPDYLRLADIGVGVLTDRGVPASADPFVRCRAGLGVEPFTGASEGGGREALSRWSVLIGNLVLYNNEQIERKLKLWELTDR